MQSAGASPPPRKPRRGEPGTKRGTPTALQPPPWKGVGPHSMLQAPGIETQVYATLKIMAAEREEVSAPDTTAQTSTDSEGLPHPAHSSSSASAPSRPPRVTSVLSMSPPLRGSGGRRGPRHATLGCLELGTIQPGSDFSYSLSMSPPQLTTLLWPHQSSPTP